MPDHSPKSSELQGPNHCCRQLTVLNYMMAGLGWADLSWLALVYLPLIESSSIEIEDSLTKL